ncbi:uncharacterized protein LOC126900180 isoform X5 [Daktulosphaira vitifoliae]|uniref:uncharacterized protein LOC126900180 isoform X2 n=1 Tax=Daktulosphaira vitifoliae TaxID=58002 RepID=UPI0021AA22CE|nr:uncharacterized protein LOC126900180 isoform X2 [Daktulosphaira vitifoliae]XP_050531626.1 uncharacterized protein LOC126900180 isoform X3 [Daktulosphaira vitifoliae]XP_050531627.1 uncharacterized protein LOC126900180 isoform X4 [Daktulosphaira vitifoliae]XP_050531628.1 uncharacterized protein LOC126900180 isoform X5 [Daktulosphaira vitifoliae]
MKIIFFVLKNRFINFLKMKISIILNIQVYFCIFITLLNTEGTPNKRAHVDIITKLLHQPGWKNINDVEYIVYRRNVYTLNDVINKPVTLNNCDNIIRNATKFLGCSFGNDLHTIFYIFYNYQEYCFMLLNSGKISAHNCIVKILEKMIEFVTLTKYMKGALYAIEKYHKNPLNTLKKTRFPLSEVLTNLQKNESLKKLISLENNKESIKTALLTITNILQNSDLELKKDLSLCKIKQIDLSSLWNSWINEFITLNSQRKDEELIIFLSDKMRNLFQRIIWNKYVTLGFKFDSNTCETFLPALSPTNNKQDIAKNSSTYLIQYTNEEDLMENVQQEYIAQNSSKNLIQHIKEEDLMENVQQEYIAQNSSKNLIQHIKEEDLMENVQQEYIAQNSSKNLIQHIKEEDLMENVQQEYIAQNSSKNLIQHIKEEDLMENVQQECKDLMRHYYTFLASMRSGEDVAQNSSKNLVRNNNDIDVFEEML